jgi:hypothetical protein
MALEKVDLYCSPWAGPADLKTTQWYMHLSPAAFESAIRLLQPKNFGDIVETEGVEIAK